MAAPQILDSLFREQIRLDAVAAWTSGDAPIGVHYSRPRLAKGSGGYPYSLILLKSFRQLKAGLKRVEQTYQYEITYVGALPASGVLDTQKVAIANALVAQVMSTTLYAGLQCTRMVTEVLFQDGQVEANETPVYEVTVIFEIKADASY